MTKHFILILLLICSQILGVPSKNDFNKKFIDVASTGNPTIVSIISETVPRPDTDWPLWSVTCIPRYDP